MNILCLSLTRLVLGTAAAIGVVSLLLPQPSWAQTSGRVDPLEDINSQPNSDPFSNKAGEDSSFSVLNLINRAVLNNGRTLEDFSTEQNQSLDAAAAQFRAKQRQRIQFERQPNPANSVRTPQTGN